MGVLQYAPTIIHPTKKPPFKGALESIKELDSVFVGAGLASARSLLFKKGQPQGLPLLIYQYVPRRPYTRVPAIGSLCSDVRMFVSALSKWNDMNTFPFCERAVTFALALTLPLLEETFTSSPSSIFRFNSAPPQPTAVNAAFSSTTSCQ